MNVVQSVSRLCARPTLIRGAFDPRSGPMLRDRGELLPPPSFWGAAELGGGSGSGGAADGAAGAEATGEVAAAFELRDAVLVPVVAGGGAADQQQLYTLWQCGARAPFTVDSPELYDAEKHRLQVAYARGAVKVVAYAPRTLQLATGRAGGGARRRLRP